MSFDSMLKMPFALYSSEITSYDEYGGPVRTATLKDSGLSFWTEPPVFGVNHPKYGKMNIDADFILFCKPLNVSSTDIIQLNNDFYNIVFIDDTIYKQHHYEIYLKLIKSPINIDLYSSSSSSTEEMTSSSSSLSSLSSSSSSSWMYSSSSSSSESYDESRYEDNGDGTVTDILTGLMWTKNADVSEGWITWNNQAAFIDNLNASNYCGYNDWRLPSGDTSDSGRDLKELGWLDGIYNGTWQGFDRTVFENIPYKVWSSTTYSGSPAYAWYKIMNTGYEYWQAKTSLNANIWPVRGTRT